MMSEPLRSRAGTVLAILAATGWAWAVALLTTREHLTTVYTVLSAAPPLWGLLALSNTSLLTIGLAGTLFGVLCYRVAQRSGRLLPPPTRWLLVAWIVPLLDVLRLAGGEIPCTFLEPILIAAVTGAAAKELVGQASQLDSSEETVGWNKRSAGPPEESRQCRWDRAALVPPYLLSIACAAWWYCEAQRAYDNYLLGYNDFGHFACRVANTWEGRGFLMETPGLPAFWDHFNPGLALLAPLWGRWPDARLFLLIQAVCLALPAPLVYAIARRLGGTPTAAAAWAAAYVAFPAVGQLNLNCTYGWHPVSLALPLLFVAVAAWLRGWRVAAGGAAVLACSFQEDVIAVLACLSLMMALAAWRNRKRDDGLGSGVARLADGLPWWGWLAVCAFLVTGFAAVFEFAPFSRYQVGRFDRLGGSFGEILFSPLLRPRVFWGTVIRPQSIYFLLALLVPLGLSALRRGWVIFAATLIPLGVLVAWGHSPATSIAFQYTTALVPIFFLAAMVGAATPLSRVGRGAGGEGTLRPLLSGGVAALAACATASTWFGALPWTQATLTDVIHQTYASGGTKGVIEDRRVGSPGNAVLNRIVEQVGGRESSVLATGRIASHLLRVRRLDTVAQAGDRWQRFQAEIGPGRSPIELFDWIVIDTAEGFFQSPEQCRFIVDQARRAGYRMVAREHDVTLYARPSLAASTPAP